MAKKQKAAQLYFRLWLLISSEFIKHQPQRAGRFFFRDYCWLYMILATWPLYLVSSSFVPPCHLVLTHAMHVYHSLSAVSRSFERDRGTTCEVVLATYSHIHLLSRENDTRNTSYLITSLPNYLITSLLNYLITMCQEHPAHCFMYWLTLENT